MEHEEMRGKGEKRGGKHVTRRWRLCKHRVRVMQGYTEHRSEAVLTQDWGQCSTAIYVYK